MKLHFYNHKSTGFVIQLFRLYEYAKFVNDLTWFYTYLGKIIVDDKTSLRILKLIHLVHLNKVLSQCKTIPWQNIFPKTLFSDLNIKLPISNQNTCSNKCEYTPDWFGICYKNCLFFFTSVILVIIYWKRWTLSNHYTNYKSCKLRQYTGQ